MRNPLVSVSACPKCGRKRGERHKTTTKRPSLRTMEKWMDEGVARATDGCRVEPDGICPHGHSSWLLVLGHVNPLSAKEKSRISYDILRHRVLGDKNWGTGHYLPAEYHYGKARGKTEVVMKYNPRVRASTTAPVSQDKLQKALSMRERYLEDTEAGHKDAAEYWRGQAGAYFTGNPLRQFTCSICGAGAPKRLLPHSKFSERMSWLRHHYQRSHPVEFKGWYRNPTIRAIGNPILETIGGK